MNENDRRKSGLAAVMVALAVLAMGAAGCVGIEGTAVAPGAEFDAATLPAVGQEAPGAVLGSTTGEPTVARRAGDDLGAAAVLTGTTGLTATVPTGAYVADISGGERAGGQIRLDLAEDGVAQLVTSFADGAPAIVEIGTWQSYSDGSLSVVLTMRVGEGELTLPNTLVLVPEGELLAATEFDPALFGDDALTLTRQPAP